MRGDHYKHVYLASTSHSVADPPKVYEQIEAIVKADRICTLCLTGFSQGNPCVAENVFSLFHQAADCQPDQINVYRYGVTCVSSVVRLSDFQVSR